MTFLESTANENLVVEVAYEMAEKMFGRHYNEFASLSIDKDDWLQDAVMYILGLYRKEYFELREEITPEAIIYTLLKRHVKNYFQLSSKKQKRVAPSLNSPDYHDEYEQGERFVQTQFPDVEEEMIFEEDIKEGKQYLNEIVEKFDVTELKGAKHTYKGKYHKALGKNFKLSERNIGILLIHGSSRKDILAAYGVLVPNIGADSKATFVNRKAKYVMALIQKEIQKLSEEAQNAVKTYILNM